MSELQKALQNRISSNRAGVSQYKNWVRSNPHVVGLRQQEIERECAALERSLDNVRRAAGRRMCIGVFGPSQAGKSYLISSLASKTGKKLIVRAGTQNLNFIGDINPLAGGEESTGVVTRFTKSLDVPDLEFPIELSLLSEMDIACILLNAYFKDCQEDARTLVKADQIQRIISQVSGAQEPQKSDTALAVMDYLKKILDSLYFANYFSVFDPFWGRLSEILDTGSLEERIEVYALFWGQNEYLTGVFRRMAETLAKLGNPDRCWATTGIFESSGINVITVEALSRIWGGSGVETTVQTREGKQLSVDHSTLSALIVELKVVVFDPPGNLYETTDLLDFPGARTRNSYSDITAANIGLLLTRGKVAYLFDRYLENRELTSMLLCVGDSVQEVGELPGMIDKWISVSHGSYATSRSHDDCALFMVLTKADLHFSTSVKGATSELEKRMRSSTEKFLSAGDRPGEASIDEEQAGLKKSWIREWVPGEAFRNMYWFRNTKLKSGAIESVGEKNDPEMHEIGFTKDGEVSLNALSTSVTTSNIVRSHFADPDLAWKEMLGLNDGGRNYLMINLQRVCRPDFKLRQLEHEFHTFKAKVDRLLSEFFADGDAGRIFKERVKKAREVVSALQVCSKEGKFGELLLEFYLTEPSVKQLLLQLERDTPEEPIALVKDSDDDWLPDIFGEEPFEADGGHTPPEPVKLTAMDERYEYMANRVMDAWYAHMQERLNNTKMARYFSLTEDNLDTIFRELRDGASRIQLLDKVADTSREASRFPRRAERLIPHKARLASQVVNGFVNQLGFERGELKLKNAAQTPVFERPKLQSGELPQLPRSADHREVQAAKHWAYAFYEFCSRNAKEDNGMAGVDLEANAILGRIIDEVES